MTQSAAVLLSGGLDSATTLAWAKSEGFACHALSFRYGQRHAVELEAARAVADHLGVASHRIIDLDLAAFGGSALTGDAPVPKDGVETGGIPVTYVPARNTIFLSMALGLAEAVGGHDIVIGVNAVDYSGYPDCRPAFIEAFQELANLATREGIEGRPFTIHAPLMRMTKRSIIDMGLALGVDYGLTRSCYDPDGAGRACGLCDSCRLRLAAFSELGRRDPAPYAPPSPTDKQGE